MSGFTQGSWFAEPSVNRGTFELYARTPEMGTQLIGEFYAEDMSNQLPALANLRLAAAAPELLAAVDAFLKYDSADDDRPNAGVQMMLDYDTALTLAKTAYAKARGTP